MQTEVNKKNILLVCHMYTNSINGRMDLTGTVFVSHASKPLSPSEFTNFWISWGSGVESDSGWGFLSFPSAVCRISELNLSVPGRLKIDSQKNKNDLCVHFV